MPLGKIVRGFPATEQLHPFEQALLVLTIGPERYERHLAGVNSLRKSLLEVSKLASPVRALAHLHGCIWLSYSAYISLICGRAACYVH